MVKRTDNKIKWAVVTMQVVVSEYRGGGLILHMRLQSGTITVSRRQALDLEHFETQNDVFNRKMGGENSRGMFIEWSERAVRLGIRTVL